MTLIEEKNQSVETYPKQTQILEFVDKDIKNNYNCIACVQTFKLKHGRWIKKLKSKFEQ